MIREVKIEELPLAIEGGESFFREGKLPGKFNPEHFIRSWTALIQSKTAVILGAFDECGTLCGGIGGSVFPCFNTGEPIAMELFWYVLPGKRGTGLKLLRAFESWATAKGAVRIWMVHLTELNDGTMEKLYPRLGYRLLERFYAKELV